MIRLPTQIFVATAPVNLRLSFDRLAGIVRNELGAEPRTELAVVFHNRRGTHLKLLWHDSRGCCLLYKRLDHGTFRVPMALPAGARRVEVSRRELELLFERLDTAMLKAAKRVTRRKAQLRSGKLTENARSSAQPTFHFNTPPPKRHDALHGTGTPVPM